MTFDEAGSTFIELLVGAALLAVFAVGGHLFLLAVLRSGDVLDSAAAAHEAARIGIYMIERDLRGAGFAPSAALRPALQRAARDQVRIASDLNGDGDTADANEVVGYGLDGARRQLTRAQGDAPPQPLIESVAENGLRFSYYDDGGNQIADTADAAARARIKRVEVAFTIELAHPHPDVRRPIRATQTTSVALRNG